MSKKQTASSPSPSRLVVLVHGAWHGAWCWSTLQAELDRRGVPSTAIDLPGHGASTEPLGDLHVDAAKVGRVLDTLAERRPDVVGADRGVVLVGHSYGGAVITEAAHGRSDIAHLVYVAAFALESGQSIMDALSTFDAREVALTDAIVPTADESAMLLQPVQAIGALYGECPPDAVTAALPRLGPQPMATMTQPTSGSPLGAIGSTYVVCERDKAVHPDHQRTMAARCDEYVALDTDHSPFVSAVSDLADIIERAARSGTASWMSGSARSSASDSSRNDE